MEELGEALEGKRKNKGRGRLVFFYGDPLEENDENERLAYKEVRQGVI